jgi:hypothetical protein
MFVQQKTPVLPSSAQMADLERRQRLEQLKITDAQYDAFTVPVSIREGFSAKWADALKYDPDILGHVELVNQSRLGPVHLEASVKNNQAELWLCVGDILDAEETDENGEPLFVRVAASVMEKTKETAEWLRRVWTTFNPVKPLRAVKQTQPNRLCPCGSGKKHKRCLCAEYH